MNQKQVEAVAIRVSLVSIVWNVVLAVGKLLAGFLANSGAMISDGVHSASDVLSSLVVMIGVKLSGKDSDEDHPYGHERFECVAAIVLAVVLAGTGVGIGMAGVEAIIAGSDSSNLVTPGALALAAAVISLVVKEAMYWYTRAAAKQIGSGALMADAWHHRSDALSSLGSFIGILGARMGYPILDPVASVVICFFILKAALDIFRDAISKMTDRSCTPAQESEMTALILSQEGVLGLDQLKTRLFGNKIYVELEISADGNQPLFASHQIAHKVHDGIEGQFPAVKHCTVHVNPVEPG